jgi:hypothetical protein
MCSRSKCTGDSRPIGRGRKIPWHAIVGTSRQHFEATVEGLQCRAAIVAVAILLQRPIAVPRLGRFDRVALAYRLFGRRDVDTALARVIHALGEWGYTLEAPAQSSLRLALCEVFLTIRSPRLEQISAEALSELRSAIASHATLRGALMRLSRALVGLGIIATPLNPWAMNGQSTTTRPGRGPIRSSAVDGATDIAIVPEWIACVERWRATTTLSPKARSAYSRSYSWSVAGRQPLTARRARPRGGHARRQRWPSP